MATHLKYLVSLYFPCCVLIFLYTGPHDVIDVLAWTLSLWLIILIDYFSPKINSAVAKKRIARNFYDVILYVLTAIHFLIMALMLIYASQLQWDSLHDILTSIVNLIVLRILVGTTSGSSAIIVAHELIHRRQSYMRLMGRLILYTVCYEHFIISHLRNHHLTVATPHDIATACLDESFNDYWKRVLVGHFKYAWQSAMKRTDATPLTGLPYHWLANTVLQGLLVEGMLVIVILINFGWAAAFIFLFQALSAVRLLETINYYQHWGLEQGKDEGALAWVNQSSFTEYALVGLSNHIAHHQNSSTSFQNMPYLEQGPKMPHGYFVTNLWVKLNNASYMKVSKGVIEKYFQEKVV
jgi:alkane 1-monooxygenase